ncbi:hypothetical protein AVEN_118169-1 [Araneus ventricosus]|uniref:DUF4817 domain-containing protein n=1 Tax=Araneus ventricosus TaxID=182803 RepID=A0A4Y2MSU5_ARAVE|nr:hypothetical protein AVEN_118169-1 [Araneus ventricosus]
MCPNTKTPGPKGLRLVSNPSSYVSMLIPTVRANCVGWYFETESTIQVQRKFRTRLHKATPRRNSILPWRRRLLETESVFDRPRSGRPLTSDDDVKRIRQLSIHRPRSGRPLTSDDDDVKRIRQLSICSHMVNTKCFTGIRNCTNNSASILFHDTDIY